MLQFDSLDGALLVDKPAGCTSHDVVDRIRRKFNIKKVGHCGTLDPNATGLLIIVLGRGTKLSEKLMSDDKVYEGDIKFGEATDSYDTDGEITATLPVPPLTLDQLNEAASAFIGDLQQVPPMVSAKKQGGVPLYKLARKGIEVVREPRLVHIYNYRFTAYAEPIAKFRVACPPPPNFPAISFTFTRSLLERRLMRVSSGSTSSNTQATMTGSMSRM
ncbi:MAG: tRNA pseudouridine(55) synthase TruB [Verrucomicrobia bacterium]|nr:tRNA pseudouridine(55) synthase TruB [Verrucomicrobiota bacterium]